MSKKGLYIALPIVFISWFVMDTLNTTGAFKTIEPHFSGECKSIEGVVGAEDITFLPNSNAALVSSYDRRITVADPQAEVAGGIFKYQLNDSALTKISPEMADFQPHGFSLYTSGSGENRLFVINHAQQKHTVDIFSFNNGMLELVRSIESDLFLSPNDVVAVGPEQFYITNDHGAKSSFMRMLEDYLKLPLANVVYFDGEKAKEVADGISYANGINVSHDGKILYLNSVTSLVLYIYQRNLDTNELTLINEIDTRTGIDNIELDEAGDLWIGSHPQLLKFVAHAKSADNLSPSQVIKVKASDHSYDVEEVYLNDGADFSGSSVAAVKGKRMLVGAVFEPKLLDCTL